MAATKKRSFTARRTQKSTKAQLSVVAGVRFVRTLDGISEFELKSNSLRILLVPDASVPVAGCMVTYHVGSRNEAIGYTGATHILEHLMFKGSEKFNKENKTTVWDLLETKGARVNATTWYDRTNYYEVVPMEHLETAIALEGDRMRTARIREEDRQSEMTVVRNEFERGENDSFEALDKLVWSTAYQAHPYHHSTIGWRSDIENVPIERLKQFYDDFYWPDNATVTIAGNFEEKKVLNLIKMHFGRHAKKPGGYPDMYTEEPPQEGQRRVVVKRAGVDTVMVAHKIPGALHPDRPALEVLGMVLADGKTSRFRRALTDPGKTTGSGAMYFAFRDPGLFHTYAMPAKGKSHTKIESEILKLYEELKRGGITAQELAQAKRSARMSYAYRRDGVYAMLSSLNEDIATGDWTFFSTFPQAIQRVTVKDVQRVARTYLVEDQSTVGWFIDTSKK